jgi:hypothetical protein
MMLADVEHALPNRGKENATSVGEVTLAEAQASASGQGHQNG